MSEFNIVFLDIPYNIHDPDKAIFEKYFNNYKHGEWESGSTFFPRSWSQARLEYEISEAFKSHPTSKTSTSFIATSPSGIKIKFVPPSGKITKWRGWPIQ